MDTLKSTLVEKHMVFQEIVNLCDKTSPEYFVCYLKCTMFAVVQVYYKYLRIAPRIFGRSCALGELIFVHISSPLQLHT